MVMGSARRDLDGGDTLTLRGMLSPDPFMGKRGYPLLLAAGRDRRRRDAARGPPAPARPLHGAVRAPGRTALGDGRSVFVYAGLPGEPAFGPPAFMHRPAAMMSPEAPITHHWLDSTHISFGVLTAGWVQGRLEARGLAVHRARAGRGPLRHRAAADGQHGAARELEPGRQLVAAGVLGRRRESRAARAGSGRGAALGQRAVRARARRGPFLVRDARLGPQEPERGRGDERATRSRPPTCRPPTGSSSRAPSGSSRTNSATTITTCTRSAKLSIGALRRFSLTERVSLGLGALYTLNEVDRELRPSYGGANPNGAMVFLQFFAGT